MSTCQGLFYALRLGNYIHYNLIDWFEWYFNPFRLFFISIVGRVINGPRDLGSIPDQVIPKTQKMVLDTSLLNTQHYVVRVKDKWGNPGKRVSPSPTSRCCNYWKGSFRVILDHGQPNNSLGLFFSKRLGNCILCTFIFTFFVQLFLKRIFCT